MNGTATVSSRTVLLIDDDPALSKMYKGLLEEEGYQVSLAHDGSEGLAILRQGFHPKLILLDMVMPGMNGEEFIEIITQENLGLTRSLNLGLESAHGKWVARQDADDVS